MWRTITAWWRGLAPTQQALLAAGVGAFGLVATVVAVVVLDAPVWVVIVICAPLWLALRVLRYQRS